MTSSIQNPQNRVSYWHDRLAQVLETDLERRLLSLGVTAAQMRLVVTIARGDRIALCMKNGIHWVAADQAASHDGAGRETHEAARHMRKD